MRESYFEKNLVVDNEFDQTYNGQQHEEPFDSGFIEFGIAALIFILLFIGIYIALA